MSAIEWGKNLANCFTLKNETFLVIFKYCETVKGLEALTQKKNEGI